MLAALAGLPGTGKSTIAAGLAGTLGAVVLDKDRVRETLFPPPVRDYAGRQDDLCMAAIYAAAGEILRADPARVVVIDGRTFLKPGQLDPLRALAETLRQPLRVVECVCDDETARRRLSTDDHPATNRTFALYLALKATSVPLPVSSMRLDTSTRTPAECVRLAAVYLRGEDGAP